MGNGHYSLICSTLLCLRNELLCNEFFKKLILLSTFSFKQYLSTGSSLGSSCGEVGLSNITTNSLHDRNAEGRKLPEHSLVWCSKSQNKGPQIASNFSETTVVEVETIVQNENFGSCSDRFVQHISYHPKYLNPVTLQWLSFSFFIQKCWWTIKWYCKVTGIYPQKITSYRKQQFLHYTRECCVG